LGQVKSVRTTKKTAARRLAENRNGGRELPAADGWSLPCGGALAEFALRCGFLAPVLMAADADDGRLTPPAGQRVNSNSRAASRWPGLPSV
jgi:hypothetical protein